MRIDSLDLIEDKKALALLPDGKLMINTINAYSYTVARKDRTFAAALTSSGALLPDGMSIVWASRMFRGKSIPRERVTGWDLFVHEMDALNRRGGKCFFMGCSEKTLSLIREKAAEIYPAITVETYSPPYKDHFDDEDNRRITDAINAANPDLLWIGLSAPKQEKWLYENWDRLDINCHAGSIGAVFRFFAGTEKRATKFWRKNGLEWLYRLIHAPRRLWRRYIIGNFRFIAIIVAEMIGKQNGAR